MREFTNDDSAQKASKNFALFKKILLIVSTLIIISVMTFFIAVLVA